MTDTTQTTAETDHAPITPGDPGSSPDGGTQTRDEAPETDQTADDGTETAAEAADVEGEGEGTVETVDTDDDPEGDDEPALDPAAEAERLTAELADAIGRAERAEAAAVKVRGEAQDLRRRLRGAEADRDEARADAADAARGTARARQQQAEHVLADYLETPSDAWLDPAVNVDDMLDDEGNIDPVRVDAIARRVLDRHPSWQVGRALPSLLNRRGVPWGLPPSYYRDLRGGASTRDDEARPRSLGEAIRAGVNVR